MNDLIYAFAAILVGIGVFAVAAMFVGAVALFWMLCREFIREKRAAAAQARWIESR